MYPFLGTGRWSDRALERWIGRVVESSIGVRSSIVYNIHAFLGIKEGGGRDGWRLVDGNYGGATQIYGEIRLPPKKRECRMQTNSLLIPPNLTTMVYC